MRHAFGDYADERQEPGTRVQPKLLIRIGLSSCPQSFRWEDCVELEGTVACAPIVQKGSHKAWGTCRILMGGVRKPSTSKLPTCGWFGCSQTSFCGCSAAPSKTNSNTFVHVHAPGHARTRAHLHLHVHLHYLHFHLLYIYI